MDLEALYEVIDSPHYSVGDEICPVLIKLNKNLHPYSEEFAYEESENETPIGYQD